MNKINFDKRSESPFTKKAYKITIEAFDQENQDRPVQWKFYLDLSELGYKLMFDLFDLVKDAVLSDSYVKYLDNEFEKVLEVLFQWFNLESLNEHGSLENAIKQHIRKLKEYIFYLPKNLIGKIKDKVTQNESGFHYCNLETLATIIKNAIKSLRDEKIQFWNKIFQLYKKDKEAYDLEFRTKATRHKKDLNRASKITPEDFKVLL